MKFDITKRHAEVDEAIAGTDNPRHLHILNNYVRHANLEICGLWDELLAPDMIVPHPHYRFNSPTGVRVFDGMAAVRAEYESMSRTDSTVIYHTDGQIAVNDSGFIGEYVSHRFWPGWALRDLGVDIDDPAAKYLGSVSVMMVWEFNDALLLYSERSYRGGDLSFAKCLPDEVVTVAECRKKLLPLTPPARRWEPS